MKKVVKCVKNKQIFKSIIQTTQNLCKSFGFALLAISVCMLTSCARTSVYVLDKSELVRVRADETITAKFDGWVFSDRAVDRIMNSKIKGANLK